MAEVTINVASGVESVIGWNLLCINSTWGSAGFFQPRSRIWSHDKGWTKLMQDLPLHSYFYRHFFPRYFFHYFFHYKDNVFAQPKRAYLSATVLVKS